MKRFKKILLVSSENAGARATLARAVELAKRNRARLTLIEVVEELPRELRTLITATVPVELRKLAITKPTRSRRYSRILAAVDPHPSDPEGAALNVKILDLATSLARLEKSLLHVVPVWRLPHEAMYRSGRTRIPKRKLEAMRVGARDQAQKSLDELMAGYALQDLRYRVHLLEGEPRILLPELVQQERIDLIVMGTVCRTGIPGFRIGNTAENVLQHVDASVLTVKPEGFVTPVTT
jgi:nucleotide-binding universal stress UspA family protein